jgi:hypothetical protein
MAPITNIPHEITHPNKSEKRLAAQSSLRRTAKHSMVNSSWGDFQKIRRGKLSERMKDVLLCDRSNERSHAHSDGCLTYDNKRGKAYGNNSTLKVGAEIDDLLKLLRSNEFAGTVVPEYHSQYITALDNSSTQIEQQQPQKKSSSSSAKKAIVEDDEGNQKILQQLDQHIQQLRKVVSLTELTPESHSRHLSRTFENLSFRSLPSKKQLQTVSTSK